MATRYFTGTANTAWSTSTNWSGSTPWNTIT